MAKLYFIVMMLMMRMMMLMMIMMMMMMMMMMSKELKKYNLFGSHTFVFQMIQLRTCELDCLRKVKLCVTRNSGIS